VFIVDHLIIRSELRIENALIQLLDSKGALVVQMTKSIEANVPLEVNGLQELVDGIYWIQIMNDKKRVLSKKIVKKQA